MSPTSLPFHDRTTVEPDGRETHAHTVECPRRGGSVSVQECLLCPHFEALGLDHDGNVARMVCDDGVLEAPPPEGERRRGYVLPVCDPQGPSVAGHTRVGEVMTAEVMCVREEVPLSSAAAVLISHRIGAVPVVDGQGHPAGLLALEHVVRALAARALQRRPGPEPTVAQVMRRSLASVPESAPLSQVAAVMAFERLHHVAVVSPTQQVVGIVSSLDVAKWLAQHDGYLFR